MLSLLGQIALVCFAFWLDLQKRNDPEIAAAKQWIRGIFRGNPCFQPDMVVSSEVSDYDQRVRWLMNHYSA